MTHALQDEGTPQNVGLSGVLDIIYGAHRRHYFINEVSCMTSVQLLSIPETVCSTSSHSNEVTALSAKKTIYSLPSTKVLTLFTGRMNRLAPTLSLLDKCEITKTCTSLHLTLLSPSFGDIRRTCYYEICVEASYFDPSPIAFLVSLGSKRRAGLKKLNVREMEVLRGRGKGSRSAAGLKTRLAKSQLRSKA
eukprot:3226054-Pyramimonas_sp.AAC.1